jgi:hypothetical protein
LAWQAYGFLNNENPRRPVGGVTGVFFLIGSGGGI